MPKKSKKLRRPPTKKQERFIEAYVDKKADTFLNATKSYTVAYPTATLESANSHGCEVLQSPVVKESILERLDRPRIDDLLYDGLSYTLGRYKEAPTHFHRSAELVAKMRGLMAPEQHVHLQFTEEERKKRYEEVLAKIEEKAKPSDV